MEEEDEERKKEIEDGMREVMDEKGMKIEN